MRGPNCSYLHFGPPQLIAAGRQSWALQAPLRAMKERDASTRLGPLDLPAVGQTQLNFDGQGQVGRHTKSAQQPMACLAYHRSPKQVSNMVARDGMPGAASTAISLAEIALALAHKRSQADLELELLLDQMPVIRL